MRNRLSAVTRFVMSVTVGGRISGDGEHRTGFFASNGTRLLIGQS